MVTSPVTRTSSARGTSLLLPIALVLVALLPPVSASAAWTSLGLEGEQILQLSSNGVHVFAITQDASFWDRSLWRVRIDGTEEPELVWDSSTNPSAWTVACHPLEPDTVYIGLSGESVVPDPVLLRSVDGGSSFQPLVDGLCENQGGTLILEASATSPSLLTAVPVDAPHVSVSGSGTWTPWDGPFCSCGTWCEYLDVARGVADPDVIWLVSGTPCFGVQIHKSEDGGQSWALMFEECSTQVNALVVDPVDAERVYLIRPPERLRSVDGGETWEEMDLGFSGLLAIDAIDPNIVYAASGGPSVAYSPARGLFWTAVDVTGLPSEQMPAFAADPVTQGLLFVGFVESGIFMTQIDVQSVSVGDPAGAPGLPRLVAAPNPFVSGTTLRTSGVTADGARTRHVTFRVFDTAGRIVATLPGVLSAGTISASWHGAGLDGAPAPAGVYFVTLSGSERTGPVTRLVKLR